MRCRRGVYIFKNSSKRTPWQKSSSRPSPAAVRGTNYSDSDRPRAIVIRCEALLSPPGRRARRRGARTKTRGEVAWPGLVQRVGSFRPRPGRRRRRPAPPSCLSPISGFIVTKPPGTVTQAPKPCEGGIRPRGQLASRRRRIDLCLSRNRQSLQHFAAVDVEDLKSAFMPREDMALEAFGREHNQLDLRNEENVLW